MTALSKACEGGWLDLVKYLVETGKANVEARDEVNTCLASSRSKIKPSTTLHKGREREWSRAGFHLPTLSQLYETTTATTANACPSS